MRNPISNASESIVAVRPDKRHLVTGEHGLVAVYAQGPDRYRQERRGERGRGVRQAPSHLSPPSLSTNLLGTGRTANLTTLIAPSTQGADAGSRLPVAIGGTPDVLQTSAPRLSGEINDDCYLCQVAPDLFFVIGQSSRRGSQPKSSGCSTIGVPCGVRLAARPQASCVRSSCSRVVTCFSVTRRSRVESQWR